MRHARLLVRSKPAFCPGDSGATCPHPHKAPVKPAITQASAEGSGETEPVAPAPSTQRQARGRLPGPPWGGLGHPHSAGLGWGGGKLPNLPMSPASDGLFHFCSVNTGSQALCKFPYRPTPHKAFWESPALDAWSISQCLKPVPRTL